jgi:hypothetical protein
MAFGIILPGTSQDPFEPPGQQTQHPALPLQVRQRPTGALARHLKGQGARLDVVSQSLPQALRLSLRRLQGRPGRSALGFRQAPLCVYRLRSGKESR